jgi:hypothetical protein
MPDVWKEFLMAKERTARKRAHKTEAREHRVDPALQVQEPERHPDFEAESEEAPTMPSAQGDDEARRIA